MLKHLCHIALIGSFTAIATAGQVSTDGTMGADQTLTGPNYTILQNLGATVGNNLFHSFDTFNLSQGDVATFTGADTIQNVINRVTDGNPSSIDGTIQSQVGNANFFFINPAGMVFGQHAAVDVPAAFHASTANELRFADGTAYNLVTPKGSLTAAPPEAFGFLGNTGDILIEGSQLKFKDGTEVSFTGGSVTSNNATIEVPRGSLRVYGNVDAVSNVPINGELPVGNGAITMNGGMWDVSGNGGGNIQISGGAVSITNSAYVSNDNNGSQNMTGTLRITANTLLIDSGGSITADTTATGNAGAITITVNGEMYILNGGIVETSTFATGNAGTVTVTANRLIIDGQSLPFLTGIASDAELNSTGDAGTVTINVNGEMRILNSGKVASDTSGTGNAGQVTVKAGSLFINDSKISSSTKDQSTGKAGDVFVTVTGFMQVQSKENNGGDRTGGQVASDTYGAGNAGNVTVQAGSLFIDNGRIASGAKIGSTGGDAGNVSVTVTGHMQVQNGGRISSNTNTTGDAGYIQIHAGSLTIDQQQSRWPTGILSITNANDIAFGNAGHVIVKVDGKLQILHGGSIQSSNYGSGDAGQVKVNSGSLIINGQGIARTGIMTTAQTGRGGNITITASAIVLNNSQITTSVLGAGGNGGDITLNGGYLVLDTGFIQANTEGEDAQGGNIFINMDGMLSNGGVTHIGGLERETFKPNSGRNVIQAAAPGGESGDITFSNPNDDTAASISASSNRLESIKLAKHPCEGTKGRFNFRRRGRRN